MPLGRYIPREHQKVDYLTPPKKRTSSRYVPILFGVRIHGPVTGSAVPSHAPRTSRDDGSPSIRQHGQWKPSSTFCVNLASRQDVLEPPDASVSDRCVAKI